MTKKRIQVKDKELIDRLNKRVAAVDLGSEEGDKTVERVVDLKTGKVVAEYPTEQFTETPTDPPAEWVSDRTVDIPNGEVVIDTTLKDVDKIEETRMRTPSKEQVNHPAHYNDYDVEVIEMMERVFGHEAVINFCRLNAFKYRMRAGHKDGNSLEQDLKKERWYLNYIKEHDQAPLSPGAPVTEK